MGDVSGRAITGLGGRSFNREVPTSFSQMICLSGVGFFVGTAPDGSSFRGSTPPVVDLVAVLSRSFRFCYHALQDPSGVSGE